MVKELELKIAIPDGFVAVESLPNYLYHGGILPLISNTRGNICLSQTLSPLLMLRRKLELKMNDLKELMVKPVPTWCTNCSHMVIARPSKIRITTPKQSTTIKKRKAKENYNTPCYANTNHHHYATNLVLIQ
jgi:hypothetical protein